MTRDERKENLRIINSRLGDIMSDLISSKCDLEELRCSGIAKSLDIVCGRLQNVLWMISDKEAKL